jgi:hypothetical protein
LVNLITFDGEYKSWNSSLCSFLHPPIASFLLGLHVSFNALFWNTVGLCSPFSWRNQVLRPNECRRSSEW